MEPRLGWRYERLVREHMSPVASAASGLRALPAPGRQAFSSTQAAWRFLANERVALPTLAAPLLEAACIAARECVEHFDLVVHDWSILNYEAHTRKTKRVQVTKAKLQGYELATALLVSDRDGAPLGVLAQELRSVAGWRSSRSSKPSVQQQKWRLGALATPLEFIERLPLGCPVVHLNDREADRVAHLRAWAKEGRRFVVRVPMIGACACQRPPAPNWVGKICQLRSVSGCTQWLLNDPKNVRKHKKAGKLIGQQSGRFVAPEQRVQKRKQ